MEPISEVNAQELESLGMQQALADIDELLEEGAILLTLWFSISGPRRVKRKRSHMELPLRVNVTFATVTRIYSDKDFARAFRVSRKSFAVLLHATEGRLVKDVEMGERSGRTTISADMRLGITLRVLSGASYLDLMLAFQIQSATVYQVFHHGCEVLMGVLKLPGFPSTELELHKLATGFKFSRKKANPLSGCVGTLDGISVKVKKPRKNSAAYQCRKGYYALPVQAIADSEYRFLYFSAKCVGSTHDALAFAVSDLGKSLKDNKILPQYWIACDEAYGCSENLICPVPRSQASDVEDAFNFFLSSMRIHVEQAFGGLVARFPIIKRGLEFELYRNIRVVCLCMKLHNFCIDNSDNSYFKSIAPAEQRKAEEDIAKWYVSAALEFDAQVGNPRMGSGSDSKRRQLIDIIRRRGLLRPAVTGVPVSTNDLTRTL